MDSNRKSSYAILYKTPSTEDITYSALVDMNYSETCLFK